MIADYPAANVISQSMHQEKKYIDKNRKYIVHFKSLIKYDCQRYMLKVMALFRGLRHIADWHYDTIYWESKQKSSKYR